MDAYRFTSQVRIQRINSDAEEVDGTHNHSRGLENGEKKILAIFSIVLYEGTKKSYPTTFNF